VTDPTDQEQANARAAMRFLMIRAGGWKILAVALGFSKHTMRHVKKAEKNVSPRMALRVARVAGVGVDDVIAGRFPIVGACPHCGLTPTVPKE
jgi:hypothetical protein